MIAVCVFGYLTTGSYFSNKLLTRKVDDLQIRLSTNEAAGYDYRKQLTILKQQYSDKIAAIQQEHSSLIATIQEDHATLITDQQAKFDLENTSLQLENVRLMNTAVNDLNERSQLIESVMDKIGVELKNGKKSSPSANSGGPFIPAKGIAARPVSRCPRVGVLL